MSQARVEVLHTSDCPDWQAVRQRIEELAQFFTLTAALSGTARHSATKLPPPAD